MDPQRFGRYEIRGEIGRGGMATVYHAYDPRFEREVAIKVLPREMLHDPQFRTRFEREAKMIAKLEHPAIVPVYDVGEEEGQPYFVMRYMTGGSLSDRLKKGPLSVQEAAAILNQIAPALDDAHSKGIIHRDLKPGNILFDQYDAPYVSDFGIAKFAASQTNVTGSAIVGTPAYMSPEQAQGEGGIDGRSDIYGLGVILFEMLTGVQPYQGDTPMSVVVKHITEPVPHILDVMPELPVPVEGVIERAMAKDRDQRFGSVRALAEALNSVARGETPDLQSAEVTRVAYPKTRISGSDGSRAKTVLSRRGPGEAGAPRRSLWVGLGVTALVLCVALGVGAYLMRDQIPFLAGPTATYGSLLPTSTGDDRGPTHTVEEISVLLPTDTPEPSPTATESAPAGTIIGGADLVAFLSGRNIWVMQVDGQELRQVTRDGAEKHDLQWSPEGDRLFYISGKCIQAVALADGTVSTLTCFTAADFLEAFEISPDASQVAISLNRELYIVPFDLDAIGRARTWTNLRDMNGCFSYTSTSAGWVGTKEVRWSADGKRIAITVLAVDAGLRVDMVRVIDISTCDSTVSHVIDNFPLGRFEMGNYPSNPNIYYIDWDGESLILLNSTFRFESGYLYAYNLSNHHAEEIDPLGTHCCYSGAVWSPDGSHVLFTHQDINRTDAVTRLYYVPFGTIGAGGSYTPYEFPPEIALLAREHFEAILRPVK